MPLENPTVRAAKALLMEEHERARIRRAAAKQATKRVRAKGMSPAAPWFNPFVPRPD